MTEQTEAQRLADRLDLYATGDKHQKDIEDAAAELRRLDAELMRKSDAIQRLWAERDSLRASTAHCDRCGKRLGGEGDIHTCTPDPIGDAQDRLIAELAAQPEQEPVAFEDWHSANYHQALEKYGDSYKNTHVRNRWQGWIGAKSTPPAAQRKPLTPDELADQCDAWLQSGGANNITHAFQAGYRQCEAANGITGEKK